MNKVKATITKKPKPLTLEERVAQLELEIAKLKQASKP